MKNKQNNRLKRWVKSLKESYHLNIINKDSFEEIYNTKVSKGMFYSGLMAICVLLFIISFCIISFTSIKRLVPGFESDEMHQQLLEMKLKLSEMEEELSGKVAYSKKLDTIFGEFDADMTMIETNNSFQSITSEPNQYLSNYHFYAPVQGAVSQKFSVRNKHFGIDIVCNKNEPVKAALSGKIILSLWSAEEGNVIGIQHQNNLISFYKHNSVLLKRKGDIVKAGEVVAIVGNSGELSTGPHLHFEIWQNGTAIDPSELINFN